MREEEPARRHARRYAMDVRRDVGIADELVTPFTMRGTLTSPAGSRPAGKPRQDPTVFAASRRFV